MYDVDCEIGVKTFCSLKFLTFSVLVANPKKLLFYLYKFANPARGLLIRGKKEKSGIYKENRRNLSTRELRYIVGLVVFIDSTRPIRVVV